MVNITVIIIAIKSAQGEAYKIASTPPKIAGKMMISGTNNTISRIVLAITA